MNDPKRWSDGDSSGAGPTPFERDLLGAGARLRAPRGMEDRVWSGLGTRLSAAAVGGAVVATTTKAAASASAGAGAAKASGVAAIALKTKLVVAALVVGVGTSATVVATQRPPPPPMTLVGAPHSVSKARARAATPHLTNPVAAVERAEASAAAAPSTLVKTAEVGPRPRPSRATAIAIAPATPPKVDATEAPKAEAPAPKAEAKAETPKTEAASRLREDARAVQEARTALGAGDVAGAEAHLGSMSAATLLGPERDALRVRIAGARGDHARAKVLAAAFLRAYPKSPLAPQMSKIVEGTTNE